MKKIIVDLCGGDYPEKMLEGTVQAARQYPQLTFLAAGMPDLLKKAAESDNLKFYPVQQVIGNCESPVQAVMKKRDSSLVRALTLLKEEMDAIGLVSAGNSGAVLAGGAMITGRLAGIERPALATFLPTSTGHYICMLDCGANVDLRPEQAARFAKLGAALMKSVGTENPRVAVLSVGSEETKGNAFSKDVFALLKSDSKICFAGNIEAGDVLKDQADVVITDGFAGNVLLKSVEGATKFTMRLFLELLDKNAPPDADKAFIKKATAELMHIMDFTSVGGAILLGTQKLMIKAHGSANEKTVPNVTEQLLMMDRGGCMEEMKKMLEEDVQ